MQIVHANGDVVKHELKKKRFRMKRSWPGQGTGHRSWDNPRGIVGVSGAVRGTVGYRETTWLVLVGATDSFASRQKLEISRMSSSMQWECALCQCALCKCALQMCTVPMCTVQMCTANVHCKCALCKCALCKCALQMCTVQMCTVQIHLGWVAASRQSPRNIEHAHISQFQ